MIFRALANVSGTSLLDLACGDGFYTRKFRRAGADPVVGIDRSPQQINKARHVEQREGLGIEAVLRKIHHALKDDGCLVTMIANPEFDVDKHDPEDSRTKFAYYFSVAEPDNGGLMRFHPGGFSKEREITIEFHRWHREFLNDFAVALGFTPEWHEPFVSDEGLEQYGAAFFENDLANPQSKLLRLTKSVRTDQARHRERLAAIDVDGGGLAPL